MSKKLFFIFLFTTLSLFGQKKQTQEDITYKAIDYFVANPSIEGIDDLNTVETQFWKNTDKKSKEDLLANVVLNCNKAYFENKFGKTNEAITSYEKAWKTYQTYSLTNYDIIEYCLKPLGNLYTLIGDYDNAENTIKQYYFIANSEKNGLQKVAAVLNLSNVYQNSGRINEAIDLLEKTIPYEKLTSTQKGLLYNNLGANYLLKSTKKDLLNAEKSFLKAVPLLIKDKTQQEALYNTYLNLYKLKTDSSSKEALVYFEKAKTIFTNLPNKEPRKIAHFYLENVSLLLKQNKITEAQNMLQTVYKTLIPKYSREKKLLPAKNSLYAETVLLDALDLQADLFTIKNQPHRALESYTLAFHIEELFQSLILYENSKIVTQIRNRNRIEKCIVIYQNLFEKSENSIYIEKAFQLVESTKSIVLKDHLIHKENTPRKEKLILEQFQNWNSIIINEQQKGDLANVSKINEAIKKQNELTLLLKEIKTDKKLLTNKTLNTIDLFAKLNNENAIMVEYFWGLEKGYVFTLQNNQITLQSFCTTPKCIGTIKEYIKLFSDSNSITNNIHSYTKTAASTYKKLLLPIQTSDKNLIIIPDGILNLLPFEALITKESNTTNFAKMHYLLNDYTIVYNSSASFYLDSRRFTPKEKTVLGVFPIFEKTDYTLTYSKAELQTIRNSFKGKFLKNAEATFENFKINAGVYSILHLSTHATSGDLQNPASIKFYDKEVLYSELYQMDISPNLVVLSACETGIGKFYKSEGSLSIARGFQFAGAQNLLFSLWKVNDYTTSVLMGDFYKNIKKNLPYYKANHQSKVDFLKDNNISNAKKSPYYWASFVYYGRIENKEKNSYWLPAFAVLIIGISIFALFKLIYARTKKQRFGFKK